MKWIYPELVAWGFVGMVGLLLLAFWSEWRGRRRLHRFFGPARSRLTGLSSGRRRNAIRIALIVPGLFCGLLALARPVIAPQERELPRVGMDYFILLDGSKSMLAEDLEPNRMEVAKSAIRRLLDISKGDRIGLVVFAGEAYLRAPLTFDFAAYRLVLEHVDPQATIPGGSDLQKGLERAKEAMLPLDLKHKAIVVISDGEELSGDAVDYARQLQIEHDITVHTVAVGTLGGGEIALRRPNGRISYQRDAAGNTVISYMDRSLLRRVAEAGRGAFTELDAEGAALIDLYHQSLKPLGDETESGAREAYVELFALPLLIGFLLLFLQTLIPDKPMAPGTRAILSDH